MKGRLLEDGGRADQGQIVDRDRHASVKGRPLRDGDPIGAHINAVQELPR